MSTSRDPIMIILSESNRENSARPTSGIFLGPHYVKYSMVDLRQRMKDEWKQRINRTGKTGRDVSKREGGGQLRSAYSSLHQRLMRWMNWCDEWDQDTGSYEAKVTSMAMTTADTMRWLHRQCTHGVIKPVIDTSQFTSPLMLGPLR